MNQAADSESKTDIVGKNHSFGFDASNLTKHAENGVACYSMSMVCVQLSVLPAAALA